MAYVYRGTKKEKVRTSRKRPDEELLPCGKRGAYQRHVQRGEPVDDLCRETENAYQRVTSQARRDRKKAALIEASLHITQDPEL